MWPPSSSFEAGVLLTLALATKLLLAFPFATQFVGTVSFGSAFDFWQPFKGSGSFLIAQATGWALLSLAIIVATVEWGSDDLTWMVAEALLALAAQGSIHASIRNFSPRTDSTSPLQMRIKGVVTSFVGEGDRSKGIADVFNGEMLMAWLLCFVSIVCRAVCDYMTAVPDFPLVPLLVVSSALWAFSVPLAHVSSRDKAIPLFRPFYGCAEYIALQVASWTLFALLLLMHFIAIANMTGYYAMQAFISSVPLVLVSGSIYFQHIADIEFPPSSEPDASSLTSNAAREELRHLVSSVQSPELRALLESLSNKADATQPLSPKPEAGRIQRMAGALILAFSAASVTLMSLAAVSIRSYPHTSAIFAVAGLLSVLFGCIGIHTIYGPSVHPTMYRLWMPFHGGTVFVVLQMAGWTCVSFAITLAVSFLLSMQCTLAKLPLIFVAVGSGLSGAAALVLLYASVSYLETTPKAAQPPTFFEVHAEGIVSVLLFTAAALFSSIYEMLASSSETRYLSAAAPGFFTIGAVFLAVPLAFVALRKSARQWREEITSSDITADDEPPRASTRRGVVLPPLFAAEFLALALMALIPILTLYVAYYVVHSYLPGVVLFVRSSQALLLVAQTLLIVVLLSRTADSILPSFVLDFRILMVSSLFYMVPASVGVFMVVYPWWRQTAASFILVADIVLLAVGGTALFRTVTKLGNITAVAYLLFFYSSQLLLALREGGDVLPPLLRGLEDVGSLLLCITYLRLPDCKPEETGTAESSWFQRLVTKYMVPDMVRYFNYRVIADGGHKVMSESGGQYILGFHPHGISAANRVWDQLTPQWQSAVGCAHRYSFHAANAVFRTTFMRDIGLALGCRSVTRTGILHSIRQGNSVMIVPGGQAELVMSYQGSMKQRLVTYHKGFIRIAIQEQLPLVPVFCFGEQDIQDNLHFERIQRYTAKKFGIALPFLPMGRFYLPLPCRVKQTVVVGAPIPVPPLSEALALDDAPTTTPSRRTAKPKGRSGNQGPAISDEVLNRVAKTYFDALVALIEKYKVEAGYPNLQVVLE